MPSGRRAGGTIPWYIAHHKNESKSVRHIESVGTAVAQDKPNILVIWGDDIGQFNVSAYNIGMMGYKTPKTRPSR